MKSQFTLILSILFALIVAIFAVINVDPVTVNYIFGKAEWPLIIVIIGSVFMGGLIVGSVGFVRVFTLQKLVKQLKKENKSLMKDLEGQAGGRKADEKQAIEAKAEDNEETTIAENNIAEVTKINK